MSQEMDHFDGDDRKARFIQKMYNMSFYYKIMGISCMIFLPCFIRISYFPLWKKIEVVSVGMCMWNYLVFGPTSSLTQNLIEVELLITVTHTSVSLQKRVAGSVQPWVFWLNRTSSEYGCILHSPSNSMIDHVEIVSVNSLLFKCLLTKMWCVQLKYDVE